MTASEKDVRFRDACGRDSRERDVSGRAAYDRDTRARLDRSRFGPVNARVTKRRVDACRVVVLVEQYREVTRRRGRGGGGGGGRIVGVSL